MLKVVIIQHIYIQSKFVCIIKSYTARKEQNTINLSVLLQILVLVFESLAYLCSLETNTMAIQTVYVCVCGVLHIYIYSACSVPPLPFI